MPRVQLLTMKILEVWKHGMRKESHVWKEKGNKKRGWNKEEKEEDRQDKKKYTIREYCLW